MEEGDALLVGERRVPEAVEEQSVDSMEHLPEGACAFKTLSRGDILEGTVMRVSPEEVLIDVGWKYEGTISSRELASMGPAAIEEMQIAYRSFSVKAA